MDPDLANFISIAAMKRVSRIDAEYLGKLDVDTTYCDPVFIMPEERMKYGLRNKDSVKELIAEIIREIVSTSVFIYYKNAFKDAENKSLAVLQKLNAEISDYLIEESLFGEENSEE